MVAFAVNHITAPRLTTAALFALARHVGATGVELRNDLGRPLFDGDPAGSIRTAAADVGITIVGLSQVYPFNRWSDATGDAVRILVEQAAATGADTISLIPCNDGSGQADGERHDNVRRALEEVLPLLEGTTLVALVEPLGFVSSSLRDKAETVALIDELGAGDRIKLVHDTFHHHLAGGGALFPDRTGIVHVSGIADPDLDVDLMRDEHRILVDGRDRLGNLTQLRALVEGGYDGFVSVEAFAPEVQALPDPRDALRETIRLMTHALVR